MAPLYTKTELPPRTQFLLNRVPKFLLVLTIFIALFYTYVLTFWFPISNVYMYVVLIIGQLFFLWQGLTFIHTIWNMNYMPESDSTFLPPVDVFITVAGEPVDIVEETLRAVITMNYPHFVVYILNDGYARKRDNWRDIERLADRYGVFCITRETSVGAKAGNINNGLRLSSNPFVAIFDADHVPHRDFLRKMVGYFANPKVGFVQSPQYYKNFDSNETTGGAWEQQGLFFGAILKGKNRFNAVTMCGTNMVIRRKALREVGGICDTNIAEDFVTGLFLHERGWQSVYVPEVLAEGLAPEDFLSYVKQQFRWARGSLEVLFNYNPLFKRGLTWNQKIQYLSSASYYISGLFVLTNAIIPLIFLFTGAVPFLVSTMALAIVFLPYIFLTLYIIQLSTNFSYTFRALAFSMSSWTIHIQALFQVLLGKKSSFAITSKRAVSGNFISLVMPHLMYLALAATGIIYAVMREGFTASVTTNTAWVILNGIIFIPFIRAALPQRREAPVKVPVPQEQRA